MLAGLAGTGFPVSVWTCEAESDSLSVVQGQLKSEAAELATWQPPSACISQKQAEFGPLSVAQSQSKTLAAKLVGRQPSDVCVHL